MKKETRFVSEVDQFLRTLDERYPHPSELQQKEQLKHARIKQLRDSTIEERRDNQRYTW